MRPSSFVLCILLPLPVYAGPATKPAPHPTTHLATTRLSGENNPKRLLTIYALAMANGDADRVKDSFWAETPDQRAVVDAYAHLARSVGALRKVQAGCLLTVSDVVVEGKFVRVTDEEMKAAVDQMTELALEVATG